MSANNKDKSPKNGVNASQKYKKIKLTATAVLSAIILTIIILAAFYIPKAIKLENERQKAKSNIVRYTYCLAIDYQNKEGYHIPDVWLKGLQLSDFKQTVDDSSVAIIGSNGMLKVGNGATKNSKTTIIYRLDGKIACVIYVHVVEANGYITSQSDLLQLEGKNGVYIQTENIMLSESVSVKDFSGKYYGNHKVISGLDISANGGLFNTAKSANFYGIALTNVKGKIAGANDASYGALINKGEQCNIEYCSVEGEVFIDGVNGISAIGGIAGTLEGSKRTVNEDINMDFVNACTTNLKLKVVVGEGSFKIGGVVGNAKNMIINNTTIRGNIEVAVPNASKISKLYVGGFAGELVKEYETAAYRITYLDSSYNLTSEADIIVTLNGGGQSFNSVYVGGVFGSIVNQSVINVMCSGSVTVTGGGADLFIGGVAGRAENKMSIVSTEGSIRLYVQNCEIFNAVSIETRGRIYAGGIAGYAIKIDIEECNVLMPEVLGDREGKETQVSNSIGLTSN